jgi:hypothetical protein
VGFDQNMGFIGYVPANGMMSSGMGWSMALGLLHNGAIVEPSNLVIPWDIHCRF